ASRRTAVSSSCTRSAVPRSIRALETASRRRWASTPPGRSAAIRRCSTRRPSSREGAQSRLRIPGESSLPGRDSARPMRRIVLLIDFTDVAPNAAHNGTYFDDRLNAVGGSLHSVRSYYEEVSRGALTVNATVFPMWFHSVHPMSYYGADSASGVDDANGPIY